MDSYILKRIIKVEVTGRNIDNYVKKIIKSKISIIKLDKINYRKIYLYLYYEDYLKLVKYNTIYDIKIVEYLGYYKIISFFKKNCFLLFFLLCGIIFIYFLSNIIFSVDVIHSNPKIRELLYNELSNYGIKKYNIKKRYDELEKIEDSILKNNKDYIEWLEIMESGTKYIIKVEERKKNSNKKSLDYQDIVASKSAIIKEIIAINGEKVKNINDYVTDGDIVITGNIIKPDSSNILVHAEGMVYGEVWYNVEVEYPYIYREEKLSGNSKNVLVLNFLNSKFYFLNFDKFNSFKTNKRYIFSNNLLPVSLVYEKQYELNIIDEYLTEEGAVSKAIEKAKSELLNNNKKIREVISVKVLNKNLLSSKVKLKLFISVIEDIGVSRKINLDSIKNVK